MFSQSIKSHRWIQTTTSSIPRQKRLKVYNAVVGIDLGTSNSAIAAVINGTPTILRPSSNTDTDAYTIPSVVAFTDHGTTLVGTAAQSHTDISNTFYSFKRLIGRRLSEVYKETTNLFYNVGEGDMGEVAIYSPAADGLLSPTELSTTLLQHLITSAESQLNERVNGAVITVPAHFNQRQKRATHEAAIAAGLSAVQLLQEPVAAALAYGIDGGADGETVLVVDLGGGTFDVSLLQAFEGIMEVLGTAGDSRLGGDDIDACICEWILETAALHDGWNGNENNTIDSKSVTRQWALKAAQQAKVDLSQHSSATICINNNGDTLTLDKEQFEKLTRDLFNRMAAVLEALGKELFVEWKIEPPKAVSMPATNNKKAEGEEEEEDSNHPSITTNKWAPPPRRITSVVLVGQSTLLPSVRHFIQTIAGPPPREGVDPSQAVALGAAIQAGSLMGKLGGEYSVEVMDGSFVEASHGRITGFSGWEP
jgi:molecular chaperone DnaK (HSP70)